MSEKQKKKLWNLYNHDNRFFKDTLGLGDVSLKNNKLRMLFVPNHVFINRHGRMFGGYIAAVLDAVNGLYADTLAPDKYYTATAQVSLSYLLPLDPKQKILYAESEIIKQGKRLIILKGSVLDTNGTLYAMCTSTEVVLKK